MKKKIKVNDVNLEVMKANMFSFYNEFKQLSSAFEQKKENLNLNECAGKMIPFATIGAFVAEIALKYICLKYGNEVDATHEITALFKEANTLMGNVLIGGLTVALNLTEVELIKRVEEFSNAFVDWRYIFENTKNSLKIDLKFFLIFINFIYNLAMMIDSDKQVTNE